MVPGLTQVTQNVQVAERGEYPLSVGEPAGPARWRSRSRVGGTRLEPTIDLYNVFNNNAVTNAVTTHSARRWAGRRRS